MFKFAKNRRVLWPVTIKEPAADGSGTVDEKKALLLFELFTDDEISAITKQLKDGEHKPIILGYLRDKIKGWEDIEDEESGEAVAFNPGNLSALLAVPYIRAAFDIGLWEASTGAPAKN